MNSPLGFLPHWIHEFRSIAVALLADDGRIIDANQGFFMTMEGLGEGHTTANFVEPSFAALRQMSTGPGGLLYHGLITLGAADGIKRSYSGKVFRVNQMLFVAAELDIAAFETLNTEVEHLNIQLEDIRRQLVRRNQMVQQLQEELDQLKQKDTLTGLPDRRKLNAKMGEEIARWERYRRPLALLLLDLDNFTALNQSYGRDVGDEVLKHVGTVLNQTVRSLDLVVRYGGQEFAILLPETNEMGSLIVADRMRMELSGQLILPVLEPVTASFGVAVLQQGETQDEFAARAWRALKFSKSQGKNCITMAGVVEECDHLYQSDVKPKINDNV